MEVRVWVPSVYSLDLLTSRGAVTITGVKGDIDATTSRDSIDLPISLSVRGSPCSEQTSGTLDYRRGSPRPSEIPFSGCTWSVDGELLR